jgi:hypothetical protein
VWSAEKRAEGLKYMQLKPSSHSGRVVGNSYLIEIMEGLPVIHPEPDILSLLDLSCPTQPLTEASNGIR